VKFLYVRWPDVKSAVEWLSGPTIGTEESGAAVDNVGSVGRMYHCILDEGDTESFALLLAREEK
jgi:hypothetical protein